MARPHIDFFDEAWHWPAYKFGLDMASATGALFDQFNTYATPLQDFTAFFCDVREISREASTADEFYALLRKRKEQRNTELEDSFRRVALQLTGKPSLLPKGTWGSAVCFFRHGSLDAKVTFLAKFLEKNETVDAKVPVEKLIQDAVRPKATKEKRQSKAPSKASATRKTKEGRISKASPGRARYNLRTPKG